MKNVFEVLDNFHGKQILSMENVHEVKSAKQMRKKGHYNILVDYKTVFA